ncbi:tyrosine-type recombinase/integrase [Longispora sp. K20-0274]|uniref:tyrosine-type recombinase/integrase n=1 Tax=Longispora sp. K20-0274 TaxID=3088255 RepID=UPI0039996EBC
MADKTDMERIIQDPETGTYGFRMDLQRGADNSRHQAKRGGFSTDVEALAKYRELRAAQDAGTQKSRLAGTVSSLLEGWLESRVQQLQPNTVYNYRYLFRLIKPYVGRKKASALTGRMLGSAYKKLEAKGLSRTTLRKADLILKKAYVEETGRTLVVDAPRESDRERPVWTRREACLFIEGTCDDRQHLLWRLLVMTGLRRGEACGLQWKDLDLRFRMLNVKRQRVIDNDTRKIVEKPPKSLNGLRAVALDAVTVKMLREARRSARSKYVFVGRTGQPLRPDNLTDRFNQLARQLGIRPLGPHQLRHLLASTLIVKGYGIHEVAERLGHDAATLMKYYAKVDTARRIQAAEDAATLMSGQRLDRESARRPLAHPQWRWTPATNRRTYTLAG